MMLFSFSLSSQIQQVNIIEPQKTVEATMIPYLKAIPVNLLSIYGISDTLEIQKAQAGTPIPVYYIDHDTLQFSNTWRVPLIVDGQFRSLFTIYFDRDAYAIVDFGAVVLAQNIQNYISKTPIVGLLRVFPLQRDYFITQNTSKELFFDPIPVNKNQKIKLPEIIQKIKK
jgi:hypothetical protein